LAAGKKGQQAAKTDRRTRHGTVKALSLAFLADFEQHWRVHGREVLDRLAEKYPQAYFGGAVVLAKAIRWETDDQDADGVMTPEEIMDKLEECGSRRPEAVRAVSA
jgi:hypothetical protein